MQGSGSEAPEAAKANEEAEPCTLTPPSDRLLAVAVRRGGMDRSGGEMADNKLYYGDNLDILSRYVEDSCLWPRAVTRTQPI